MKRLLGRIALIAGGLVATLVLLLVGMVVIDGLLGPGRLDAITNTRIGNPRGPEVRAFVARPAAPGKYPAVIMLHEFWGRTPEMIGKARALADEGYVVIAPNVRGSSGYGKRFEDLNNRDWGHGDLRDVLAGAGGSAAREAADGAHAMCICLGDLSDTARPFAARHGITIWQAPELAQAMRGLLPAAPGSRGF